MAQPSAVRSLDEVKHFEFQDVPHLPPASNRACSIAMRIIAAIVLASAIGVALAGFTVVWYVVAAVAGFWLLAELINQVGSSKVLSEESVTKPELPSARPITDEEIAPALPYVRGMLSQFHRQEEGVTRFYSAQNFIFKVNSVPGLVFKTSKFRIRSKSRSFEVDCQGVRDRYNAMVAVQELKKRDRLLVPAVRLIKINVEDNVMPVVVEREIEGIIRDDKQQENLYKEAKDDVELTTQLATAIVVAKLDDVEPRNFPIVQSQGADGKLIRQIAVIDTQIYPYYSFDSGRDTALGSYAGGYGGSRGLIRCLFSERQIDVAIKVAVDAGNGANQKRSRRDALQRLKVDRLGTLRHG